MDGRAAAVPVTPNQLAHSLSVSASVILSVDPSYPARVAPRRGGARAGDADGRPCLMVNPRDKEEPTTTTISQPWGTNERAAWRGERGHTGLQLSHILRHLPRTRSTGHSDPMNPGSTTCLSLPSTSLQPSLLPLPPSFCCPSLILSPFRLRQELNRDTAN